MRLLLIALLAAPAAAQTPSEVLNPDTCGAYLALEDDAARVGMLKGIEPFGDDLDAEDADAARQWADAVAAACEGRPERPLSDAAAAAASNP